MSLILSNFYLFYNLAVLDSSFCFFFVKTFRIYSLIIYLGL
jgi:hypothetical protein